MLCQAAAAAAVERCPEHWPLGTLITDPSKAASGPGQECVDTALDNYQPAPSRGLFDGLYHPDLIKADHGSTCAGLGAARVAGGCDMFVVMKDDFTRPLLYTNFTRWRTGLIRFRDDGASVDTMNPTQH